MKDNHDLGETWNDYNLDYARGHEKLNPEVFGEFKVVMKLYTPQPNEKVLEIGCNTGEFCWLLKNKFNVEPEGVDINSEAILIAKEKYPQLNLHVADFFELKGKYDVVYMQHVIEHIKNPEKAFLKLKKLLNPGGKLIITCPNKWAYTSKAICWIRGEKFCYDPTHVSEFNPKELSKLVQHAGFNLLKIKTRPGFPFIHRISMKIHYMVPSYLFGDFIFLIAEKPGKKIV